VLYLCNHDFSIVQRCSVEFNQHFIFFNLRKRQILFQFQALMSILTVENPGIGRDLWSGHGGASVMYMLLEC